MHCESQVKGTAAAVLLLLFGTAAYAEIPGIEGMNFSLTAQEGVISTPEGASIPIWGFANGGGTVQYPGPTLIVMQGHTITVELTNDLDVPVSLVFPGQAPVTTEEVNAPTAQGLLSLEALPGGTVRYTFPATHAGTYHYHSGTRPELQIEMGLIGALIVRPMMGGGGMMMTDYAYDDPMAAYEQEYLFLLTEMDPVIHRQVADGKIDQVDFTKYWPVYWFINGRCAPDTMADPFITRLPCQPYNCMPMMEPGQRMLMRIIGGGRDMHPFHHHGNHSRVIARDGRLLREVGTNADVGVTLFTVQSIPGETVDAIFTWTGEKLGWDIYGHAPEDELEPNEYAEDHGKPFPVILPEKGDLTFGGMYSGSPFLGAMGSLPVGEGGLNPMAGYTYMWHSHNEKEMVNNDIFPGGMMTMLMVVAPGMMHMMEME